MDKRPATNEFKFRAFISYCQKDEKSARWLHKALESYRVPRRLVGQKTPFGVIPRRLTPIFRDRDELKADSDLTRVVNKALDQSACLIVLCSPDAARSRWVNEEILRFKQLGRSDRILCLIVDGEPNAGEKPELGMEECYPPAVLHEIGPDGELTDERIEPIAADLRPDKDRKNNVTLKLVAGILGIPFARIKHREQRRHFQRMVTVTAMSLVVMGVTTGLAIWAFIEKEKAEFWAEQADNLIGFMLEDLYAKLQPIGRLDVLEDVADRATMYFDDLPKPLDEGALAKRAIAYRHIGEVRMAQGHLETARDDFEKSVADSRLLAQIASDDLNALFELGQAEFWVGYVDWEQGNLNGAFSQFGKYLEISKELVEAEPGNDKWLRELGYAHTNLGSLLKTQGDIAAALQHFQASAAVKRGLVSRNPNNTDLQLDLASTISWAGSALSELGDLKGALEQFEQESEIKSRLVALDPKNTLWKRRYSLGNRRLGELLLAMGDLDGALLAYETGMAVTESLTAFDASNANWQRDLGLLHAGLGRIALTQGDAPGALEHFREYVEIIENLLFQDATKTRWQRDLAQARIFSGTALLADGDLARARAETFQAQATLEALLSDHPEDREAGRYLSHLYLLDGQMKATAGEKGQARVAWLRSLELIEPLAHGSNDFRFLNIWAKALLYLGRSADAAPVIRKLAEIGFREPGYVQYFEAKVSGHKNLQRLLRIRMTYLASNSFPDTSLTGRSA